MSKNKLKQKFKLIVESLGLILYFITPILTQKIPEEENPSMETRSEAVNRNQNERHRWKAYSSLIDERLVRCKRTRGVKEINFKKVSGYLPPKSKPTLQYSKDKCG